MDPQVGRAGFRVAFYVIFVSGVMLFFLQPGTAEFVITVMSLAVGLFFALVIGILAFLAARVRPSSAILPSVRQEADEDKG